MPWKPGSVRGGNARIVPLVVWGPSSWDILTSSLARVVNTSSPMSRGISPQRLGQRGLGMGAGATLQSTADRASPQQFYGLVAPISQPSREWRGTAEDGMTPSFIRPGSLSGLGRWGG